MDVLILVLMEDTLRVPLTSLMQEVRISLNPCFNGRYSQRRQISLMQSLPNLRLNPCFNGRYSHRLQPQTLKDLLLSLNPCFNGRYSQSTVRAQASKANALS